MGERRVAFLIAAAVAAAETASDLPVGAAVLAGARRRGDAASGVTPRRRVEAARVGVVAGEHATQFVGVDVVGSDDCRGVGVVDDVVTKGAVVGQDEVDETAEERDV